MMDLASKELAWRKKKAGYISASSLGRLYSKSGKFTEGNISYLREVERERQRGVPNYSPSNQNFERGREGEPMAVEWLRMNTMWDVRHYDVDFDEKIFWTTDFGYGCSPDADIVLNGKISSLVEIKTVCSLAKKCLFFSPTVPIEEKKALALSEHKEQLIGQFIGAKYQGLDINSIVLVKYDFPEDDDPFDVLPIEHPSRGIYFIFKRSDFEEDIAKMEAKIRFADSYLKSGRDLALIDEAYTEYKKGGKDE